MEGTGREGNVGRERQEGEERGGRKEARGPTSDSQPPPPKFFSVYALDWRIFVSIHHLCCVQEIYL